MDADPPRTRAIRRRPPRASRACETCRVRKTKVFIFYQILKNDVLINSIQCDQAQPCSYCACMCIPDTIHIINGAYPKLCLCYAYSRPLSRLYLQNRHKYKPKHGDTGKENKSY